MAESEITRKHGALGAGLGLAAMAAMAAILFLLTGTVGAEVVEGPVTGPIGPSSGTVQFDAASYTVSEGSGTVTLTLTRRGGSAGAISATIQTFDGTATIVDDYAGIPSPLTLTWVAGNSNPKTVTLPIKTDALAEGVETFRMTLTSSRSGTPSVATVSIIDDPPGTIQFGSANYAVSEAGNTITLELTRQGGDSGQISATIQTVDGTATIVDDYAGIPSPLTLTWVAGNTSPKTVTLPIKQDLLAEGNETFTMTIAGANVGVPAIATVTIIDDEALPDSDFDTISDPNDNCPSDPNVGQADADGDGIGDVCDPRDGRIPAQCAAFQGANVIVGTNGADVLTGTSGSDVIIGLRGNDRISGKGGRDCIVAGAGNDIVNAGRGNDVVFGGAGNDNIKGRRGRDTIHGNRGADVLRGNGGPDKLFGDAGTDRCRGGSGNNQLFSCEI